MWEHADFADSETLLERLQNNDRDVVFLVGSAITAPRRAGEPGVPGVSGVIDLIRQRYAAKPEQLVKFEQALEADPRNRYQAAFRRLLDTRGQDAANRVIREAVWRARRAEGHPRLSEVLEGNRETCLDVERDLDGWHLSPAVEGLGRVIAGLPGRFGQVVLTTNFDPLLEVGIRRAGGQAFVTVLHDDGSLEQTEASGCRVVHLHGHWFRSDTLHTPVQLKQSRPKLHTSLAKLLQERTLVVVGYGGWDDVFTRSLIDVVKGGLAKLDVLWTFYNDDTRQIIEQHAKLLGDLESGIGRGRVRFYKGIDAHSLFPALLSLLEPDIPKPYSPHEGSAYLFDGSEHDGGAYLFDGSEAVPRPLAEPKPVPVAPAEITFIPFRDMRSEPPPAEPKPPVRPETWPPAVSASSDERLQAAYDRYEELLLAGASKEELLKMKEDIRNIRREMREGRPLQSGDILSNQYRLLERVGVGGFAVVWKALDRRNRELVAVKILHGQHADDRSRVERFYRGAKTMERLNHQNIVRVIEPRAQDAHHHYFVMEFLAGGDFRQAVLSGSLSRERVWRVIEDVGKALEYGHGLGIVHRDVKPQNILLGNDESVRLTDFDLVHVADSTGGTRTGALGTFVYAPPEELSSGEAEARGDIFSLGMTALFGLYGKDLPWAAFRDARKFVAKIDCSNEIKAVLERAVRWESQERYPAMRAFYEALREAAALDKGRPPGQASGGGRPAMASGLPTEKGATGRTLTQTFTPVDLEEAEAVYRTTMEEFPDDIVARNGLAGLLRLRGRYGESEALYRATAAQFPDNLIARNGLAGVLAAQGRHEESEALYRETVRRFPDDVVARNGVASVLLSQGRPGEAEAYYRETLQRFPDDVTAKNGVAEILKAQGR